MSRISATMTDLEKINSRIEEFANIEHVQKLRSVWIPRFEAFGEKIDSYLFTLNDIKVSVVSIDNALNLKASKSQVQVMEENIRAEFLTKQLLQDIQKENNRVTKQIEEQSREQKEYFESLNEKVTSKIKMLCEQLVKERFVEYDQVKKEFKQFFNMEELTRQFDKKADISLFHMLNHSKVQVHDFQQLVYNINKMNEKMQHLSMIQVEMTSIMIPFKQQIKRMMDQEETNQMYRDMKNIEKSAKIVQKWIGVNENENLTQPSPTPVSRTQNYNVFTPELSPESTVRKVPSPPPRTATSKLSKRLKHLVCAKQKMRNE